jgi:hypothetical protein
MTQSGAYRMIGRRARRRRRCEDRQSFVSADRVTACLKNGGVLENAAMANHAPTRTTQLYDRRRDELTLDEVGKVGI